MCSTSAASQLLPRSTSTSRPSTLKAALLYENSSPGVNSWGRSVIAATYFSIASSPRPVSVNTSPSKPPLWLSSWRVVMAAADASSASRNSGR